MNISFAEDLLTFCQCYRDHTVENLGELGWGGETLTFSKIHKNPGVHSRCPPLCRLSTYAYLTEHPQPADPEQAAHKNRHTSEFLPWEWAVTSRVIQKAGSAAGASKPAVYGRILAVRMPSSGFYFSELGL